MKKTLIKLFSILTIAPLAPGAHAIEEPAYTVVRTYPDFEIRAYAPYIVAETTVAGSAEDAGNQGFRILAAYIFGQNKGERKIDMTAPVSQAPEPTKIAMTAPVSQAPAGAGFVVRFTMPASFTLATLPEPLDPRIRLLEVPRARFAVIRYSGRWSDANYSEHLSRLEQATRTAGIATRGEPIYSRYDAPFVPWFMRRNEIWLTVD